MRIGLIQCGCILRLAVLLSCEVVAAPIEEWLLGEWLAPRDTIPAPIVIAASQDWDGNDGPWSSFPIQIGTPAQTIKVFPATSGYKTMAVMPGGCIATDPSSCFSDRGGFYTPSLSTTQVNNTADPTTNIYPIALDERLGYLGKAALGFDTVTLGWPGSRGPTLINQTVGGFITKERYFGSFGLLPRAANFTATFDHPIPSYMQNLVSQKKIPSTSWSYTAGNQYRLNKVLGSLVLGGYDSSKFVPNDVIFPFNDIDELDLTVQLESIKMTDGNTSLLEKSIPAMVDSSEAMIWLPDDACILFEKAFGLTWNDTLGYYLLSGEQHATLVAQDPTLVFTLGNLTAGATVDITLPYSAFNLNVSSPIVPTTQYYFPLQRAANDTQYTLGRTFFQEAYITADYDRRTFTVSQASWVAGATSKIVSILPPTSESMTTSGGDSTANSTENAGKAKKVPVAAIAGGAGGGAILLIFAALLAFFCCIRPRRREAKANKAASGLVINAENDHTATDPNAEARISPIGFIHKVELDSSQVPAPLLEMTGDIGKWAVEADGCERMRHEVDGKTYIYEKDDEGRTVVYEMDAREKGIWLAEADGNLVQIYEMPAGEVAHEMHESNRDTIEETSPESTSRRSPRYSWETNNRTLVGSSPAANTQVGPGSATIISPPDTESSASPRSCRARLQRLPE